MQWYDIKKHTPDHDN